MRVATIDGVLEISRLQPAGKGQWMRAAFEWAGDSAGHVFALQPDINNHDAALSDQD